MRKLEVGAFLEARIVRDDKEGAADVAQARKAMIA